MPRKHETVPVELPAIPAGLLEQSGNGPMRAESISRYRATATAASNRC